LRAGSSDFLLKKHNLVQAMQAVNDFLRRNEVMIEIGD